MDRAQGSTQSKERLKGIRVWGGEGEHKEGYKGGKIEGSIQGRKEGAKKKRWT